LAAVIGVAADAAAPDQARNQPAIDRIKAENPGAKVSINPATGTARFVRLGPTSSLRLGPVTTQATKEAATSYKFTAAAFINRHAAALGLRTGMAELALRRTESDSQGQTHLTYTQQYAGLPVFGGVLKAHFDANGRLSVVNGTLIPDIDVSAAPSRSAQEAEAAAVSFVKGKALAARGSRLLIFREGLAKGVPGENRLAYEVEVGNGKNVREFVYVDAHTGKPIDQISGTMDALFRRAFDGAGANPGPNYPASPFWVEGDAFPTGTVEADNMILASGETYDLFFNAFARDSFDGAGAIMDAIFNRGGIGQCPNASWNGTFISFCPGITTDDVTGHEWGHAYTEYTDGLIYAWQPGALNEAASDIFGETVDRINGRDTVGTNGSRTDGSCSVFTTLPPTVTINSPAAIAGVKPAGTAAFGLQTFTTTNDVVLANDGIVDVAGTTVSDGCCASPSFACVANSWPNAAAIAGKFAMVDRGVCGFAVKTKNAQLNGALGVIVANNQGGTAIVNMAGVDPTVTVPALSVTQNDGIAIKGQLASTTVNATISRGAVGSDNTARWLMGEDSTAVGLVGALRDMWNPNCYGDPGKVTDSLYQCAATDGGGVHTNSGVDNRAYSLMVDGGTYNSQTVTGIGLTKAAHVYFRAKIAYQHPASDFADHADALEQSCSDLTGVNLASFAGGPSGEVISTADCSQVAKAILATEMRTPPTQCNFQPLLAQNPPAVCPPGKTAKKLFFDNFENGTASADRFTETHEGTTADFTERDWSVASNLPDGRPGKAFFGPDYPGGTCAPGGDETAVLHLDSPVITVPSTAPAPRVVFDHWVATEAGWDGGNVKISVNGGAWQLLPDAAFIYNAYNATLFTAGQGNSNPIAGQRAFTGSDGGAVDGSWGRSIIDLTGIANRKDKIRLRFDLGNDGCFGTFGWYVDDLQVLQCR
jgi:Zn-dependent metalloprotease